MNYSTKNNIKVYSIGDPVIIGVNKYAGCVKPIECVIVGREFSLLGVKYNLDAIKFEKDSIVKDSPLHIAASTGYYLKTGKPNLSFDKITDDLFNSYRFLLLEKTPKTT